MICSFGAVNSSRPRQGVPLSSLTVRSTTTENCLRINEGDSSDSWSALLIPINCNFLPSRRPIPQTSSTGTKAINFRCRPILLRSTTPRVAGQRLLAYWASLARVFVGPIPTDPDPKSCSIQKQNSGMINTPLNGGGADEKVTIHRRADCFCPEAG